MLASTLRHPQPQVRGHQESFALCRGQRNPIYGVGVLTDVERYRIWDGAHGTVFFSFCLSIFGQICLHDEIDVGCVSVFVLVLGFKLGQRAIQ
jgi:hypothetical protein